jgi:hypothetical protein
MNTLTLAMLTGAFAMTSVTAAAQDVGTPIFGNDGNPVGTVTEVSGPVVVIDTGRHKAPVPTSLVFDGDKGKTVNATKDQVDAMMDERVADARLRRDAALAKGAAVVSVGGRGVGTLASVDLAADAIVLMSPDGPVRLKKEHFAVNPQGHLTVLYNRDQITGAALGKSAATTASAK